MRNKPPFRIALAAGAAIVLVLVPSALAGKPGGHSIGSCTQKAPGVVVDNNWQWGCPGSFGLPGQPLTYSIDVINYDAGCSSSTFTVSVAAPSGFAVGMPTNTIALKSGSQGYVWATVTSPSAIADGDYPLTVTVQRPTASNSTATYTSYYKVYSSDTVAPTLFYATPANGTTISGRSFNFSVSSSDDHAVKHVDLYIDNNYVSTVNCDDVSFTCLLNYTWATTRGQHTATFKSYDWMGNVGTLTNAFTVS